AIRPSAWSLCDTCASAAPTSIACRGAWGLTNVPPGNHRTRRPRPEVPRKRLASDSPADDGGLHQSQVLVDLALVGVDGDRFDLVEGDRPPGPSGLEEGVDERGVAAANLAGHLGLAFRLDAFAESVVLGRQDLRVDLDKGELVGPDALAAEELRRQRAELVAGGVVEDAPVGDLDAVVEVELERPAVAVARRLERP